MAIFVTLLVEISCLTTKIPRAILIRSADSEYIAAFKYCFAKVPFIFSISGGKDSCYNMMQCVQHGHDIVALANLRPRDGGMMWVWGGGGDSTHFLGIGVPWRV